MEEREREREGLQSRLTDHRRMAGEGRAERVGSGVEGKRERNGYPFTHSLSSSSSTHHHHHHPRREEKKNEKEKEKKMTTVNKAG